MTPITFFTTPALPYYWIAISLLGQKKLIHNGVNIPVILSNSETLGAAGRWKMLPDYKGNFDLTEIPTYDCPKLLQSTSSWTYLDDTIWAQTLMGDDLGAKFASELSWK